VLFLLPKTPFLDPLSRSDPWRWRQDRPCVCVPPLVGQIKSLLGLWGKLHWVRTVLGTAAFVTLAVETATRRRNK
jgi:hypothetical protein